MTHPWSAMGSAPSPYDDQVGPFPHLDFIDAWYESIGQGERLLANAGDTMLPLVDNDGIVSIAGSADVTDYHSPLGDQMDALASQLAIMREGCSSMVLDSLPDRSARDLADALRRHDVDIEVSPDIATAVICVEDDYLGELSKKQRHEVRRKHRKYQELVGEPVLEFTSSADALDRFVAMHKSAPGDKGDFFGEGRTELFARLLAQPSWEIAELRTGDAVVASLFGSQSENAYYLYNSAYDFEYREASPGIVVLYLLIEHLSAGGCRRIDLLKGDETYKFRMGAVKRELHRIEF